MKKTQLAGGLSLALFLMVLSFAGHAAVVTWQLVDVTFADGGVAIGSFNYDADTETYSAISIETSGGIEPAFANTPSYGVPSDAFFLPNASLLTTVPTLLSDYTGSFFLGFLFESSLTNAGGTIPVNLNSNSGELICVNAACNVVPNLGTGFRVLTGGSVSAVPVPSAPTINVPGDFPTIQQGIDAAVSGDTVLVAPGTYFETPVLKTGINLVGSGLDNTIIDGQGIGNLLGSVVVGATDTTISEFTIRNSFLSQFGNIGACIDSRFSSMTIRNNRIKNCRIGVISFETMVIESNLIDGNPTNSGLFISLGGHAVIRSNTIVNNNDRGIIFGADATGEVVNNIIANNTRGISQSGAGDITVEYNDVHGNSFNYDGMADQTGLNGNISADPLFVDPAAANYRLQAGSPAIDAGNPAFPLDPDSSRADMGAFPFSRIPLVAADWQTPRDGAITRDLNTGLDWLDLTESLNLTVADVKAQLVQGGTFEGFRLAAPEEVGTLFSSAGLVGFATEPFDHVGSADPAQRAAAQALQDLWGVTDTIPNGVRSIGYVDEAIPPGSIVYFIADLSVTAGTYLGGTRATTASNPLPGLGAALVRTTPPVTPQQPANSFFSGSLGWTHVGESSVKFIVRKTWQRGLAQSAAFQCIDPETVTSTLCTGNDGMPRKGELFMERLSCPKLSTGDGTIIGSPSVEGCLIYTAIQAGATGGLMLGTAVDATQLPDVVAGLPHTYASTGVHTATVEGCCRTATTIGLGGNDRGQHLNNSGKPYRLETTVDIGSGDISPSTAIFIESCAIDSLCEFEIPSSFTEGVTFRLSQPNEASSDVSFRQPGPQLAPNQASIDPITGRFVWDTSGATLAAAGTGSLYSSQITLEHGATKSSADFLISLFQDDTQPPEIEPPEDSPPVCRTSFVRNQGGRITFSVTASDPDANDTVTLNATGIPIDASLHPELPLQRNPVTTRFEWRPLQVGSFVFNFHAQSSSGASVQCPVSVEVVNVVAPDPAIVSATFSGDNKAIAWFTLRPVATVTNYGNLRATTRVRFQFKKEPNRPSIVRSRTIPVVLEPGETRVIRPNDIRISHDAFYRYSVKIDPRDSLIEIDENNNEFISPHTNFFGVGRRN